MANGTARHRPVFVEGGGGMPMAIEAEAVKPSLHSLDQVGARTPVALDAGLHAHPIGIVVMACEAVDPSMLVVREVERERDRAPNDRLPQRRVDFGGQQRCDAGGACDGGNYDQVECRPKTN